MRNSLVPAQQASEGGLLVKTPCPLGKELKEEAEHFLIPNFKGRVLFILLLLCLATHVELLEVGANASQDGQDLLKHTNKNVHGEEQHHHSGAKLESHALKESPKEVLVIVGSLGLF